MPNIHHESAKILKHENDIFRAKPPRTQRTLGHRPFDRLRTGLHR
jgi:hypothetical protein